MNNENDIDTDLGSRIP